MEQKLTASDHDAIDEFGVTVGVHDDVIVVGSPREDEACGGEHGGNADAAGWNEHQELIAFDADTGDRLGASVSVDGQVIVVGSPGEDEGGNGSGSAYAYELAAP